MKNIAKNVVISWSVKTEVFIEVIGAPAHCTDSQCLTGPAHPASAAPEPPASLSARLFGRATVPISGIIIITCHLGLITHSVLSARATPTWINLWVILVQIRVSPLQAAPDQFRFSPVTSVLIHVWVRALSIVLSESCYMTSVWCS